MHELDDDALLAFIRSAPDGPELTAALEELFSRLRAEASLDELAYVEAVIARLRWTFGLDDEDGGAGVREPRRPPPDSDHGALRLAS